MHHFNGLRKVIGDVREMLWLPSLNINLMEEAAHRNQPFYGNLVRSFYAEAQGRHPKVPLLKKFRHGIATCVLPETFDIYFMAVKAAARRNYKKAQRNGYTFARIDYNNYLDDVGQIRSSAEYRHGPMPNEFLGRRAEATSDPAATSACHDYPYFGVLKNGTLYAYAGCFVAGELCHIEHMLGHAGHQQDGIVPMLIISIAEYLMQHHPCVKYYVYGTFFGASKTMRRFKRKFRFVPHRVNWQLGGSKT